MKAWRRSSTFFAKGGIPRHRVSIMMAFPPRKCQRKHTVDRLSPQQRDFATSPANPQAAHPSFS
jgi:hypothetical protein